MKKKLVMVVVLAILLSQPVEAAATPITITFGRSWPISIVIDQSKGLAYADGTSGDYPPTGFTFGIINLTSDELVKVIPLDEIPGAVALDQSDGDVFVAGNYSIEVYNAANQSFIGLIEVGQPILYMTYNGNASNDIFVTSGKGVYAVDPQTSSVVANATVPGGPEGMVLDSANGRLYVSEYLSPAIAVFEAANLEQIGSIALPKCCASWLALNPSTQTLYASTGTPYVDIVNAANDSFTKSVTVAHYDDNSTNAIAVNDVTGRVYVASSPGGSVLELDGSTGAVIRTFKVQSDSQVAGLAVDTRNQELYATNYHEITAFDIARPRAFLFVIVLGAVVVAVAAMALYFFLRRRDERDRAQMQSGSTG